MRIRGFVALLISLTAVNLAVPASVSAQTGASTPEWQIITNYRKLIVLAAVEDADNEDDVQLTNVVGKIIFHENRRTLANLEEVIYTELTQPNSAAEAGTRFVELLSATKDIWDADKLAFLGMVESLLARLENVPVSGELKRLIVLQLKGDVNTLKRVQARYNDELGKVIARFSSRAMQDRRQAWDEYLNYISALHSKTAILADYQDQPLLPASRGAKAKTAKPAKKSPEMFGYGLPAKTLVLTFDDGPHHSYSEKIMAIMAKYNIKPIFFHVGENLGKVDKSGKVKLSRSAEISKKLLKSGAVLANHSYTHSVLPKLSQDEVSTEINTTNSIIENITGEKTILFRPPYGARNESMLAWIKASHLSSIMWNIDSKDWADPVPKSIAQRVVDEVEKKKKGIILFHDIQPQTVEALPLLLDELVSRGYQFAEWDGKAFSVANVKKPAAPVVKTGLYRESWAVVIGVDKYTHWPKLRYAVNDAKGIKEVLVNKFGFKTENIFTLYDEQATRDNILSLFHDKLGDSGLVQKEDRVMIFYAGHGATRKLHSGRELGYIIPVDADNKNYFGQSISMTNISDISEAIPAKHLFFVMDSCYSGMALTRG
ncbi:MAG: polysaccharide deacetylase family protein, partial [Gammaproteobacteria bacterium]|nr:polysaccharide deacetylase family protein [Gammaproteobacteria bacterium]